MYIEARQRRDGHNKTCPDMDRVRKSLEQIISDPSSIYYESNDRILLDLLGT
jgi:hypothetical protein